MTILNATSSHRDPDAMRIALVPRLPAYGLIFMGDVIEHLDKPKGLQLVQVAVAKAKKAVIVTTPKFQTAQELIEIVPLHEPFILVDEEQLRSLLPQRVRHRSVTCPTRRWKSVCLVPIRLPVLESRTGD